MNKTLTLGQAHVTYIFWNKSQSYIHCNNLKRLHQLRYNVLNVFISTDSDQSGPIFVLSLVVFSFGLDINEKLYVRKWGTNILLLGGNSQNFLCKFVRFFVTLGLKILRLFRLKVLFKADIFKSNPSWTRLHHTFIENG